MYVPPAFREDDRATLHAAINDARLSHLVTATTEGLIATPLPLFLAPDEGPHGTLYGHVSRANEHWKLAPIGDAMALFMGPHAYVSPSWYPSKQEHHKVVPTWNYLAVHAYGPVEFFEDAERLLDVVTRLTNLHEMGSRHAMGRVRRAGDIHHRPPARHRGSADADHAHRTASAR